MTVRVPALDGVHCPKCGAENIERKVCVWKVADERGPHHECDVCAETWQEPGQVAFLRIGRFTCLDCRNTGTVVMNADVRDVMCPRCGGATAATHDLPVADTNPPPA